MRINRCYPTIEMNEKYAFEIDFYERLLKRNPHYLRVIEILGTLYTQCGRINEGLKMDRKLVRLQPENPTAQYNLACSLALKGRKREAVDTLRKAIDLGYKDYEWLKKDPDLHILHTYPLFKKLLAEHGYTF